MPYSAAYSQQVRVGLRFAYLRRELRLILISWIYFGTGFQILVICLCLSRKLLSWNNRLSRASSPTTFSPGRWWPLFVPFTRRSFCPWMIQLYPSCRSPFQRPVAVWLRASTSNATFVTLKRRQLLLSLVVPSVSDAQGKNLLLDPFFQTSSLFSSLSVEAACSATRDLSFCSDRILTCRIKSICSPAKGGTGCYRFNYQPGS